MTFPIEDLYSAARICALLAETAWRDDRDVLGRAEEIIIQQIQQQKRQRTH